MRLIHICFTPLWGMETGLSKTRVQNPSCFTGVDFSKLLGDYRQVDEELNALRVSAQSSSDLF